MRLTAAQCRDLLESQRFAVLGTPDPDHGTHLVPVVFELDGDDLVVPLDTVKPKTSAMLRRVANLERDPLATLLVDHRSEDWDELWWVRADLAYRGVEDPDPRWMDQLSSKYPAYQEPGAVPSIIRFTLLSTIGWAADVDRIET